MLGSYPLRKGNPDRLHQSLLETNLATPLAMLVGDIDNAAEGGVLLRPCRTADAPFQHLPAERGRHQHSPAGSRFLTYILRFTVALLRW